jgi:hypothetical protein
MGRRIRLFEPGIVYNVTHRTVDRQFLFRPNHHPRQPLLDARCSPQALDPNNRIIPVPSVINIVGSSYVRAMQHSPVQLHCCELNINHPHDVVSQLPDGEPGSIPIFYRNAKSLIARQINWLHKREGHVFGGPYRMEPCLDNESAEAKWLYAMTNTVKDGLVEKVSESPFLSTYKHQAFGEPLRFWWINWSAFHKAGGWDNKNIHPKMFMKWGNLEITPLPHLQNLPEHKRQTRVRQTIREQEQVIAEQRKAENKTVIGVPALYRIDPRDRPKDPKKSGSQPLCHTIDRELRREFAKRWRDFRNEHKKASHDFRQGYYEREFPEGSFRPPLIKIYTSTAL